MDTSHIHQTLSQECDSGKMSFTDIRDKTVHHIGYGKAHKSGTLEGRTDSQGGSPLSGGENGTRA